LLTRVTRQFCGRVSWRARTGKADACFWHRRAIIQPDQKTRSGIRVVDLTIETKVCVLSSLNEKPEDNKPIR